VCATYDPARAAAAVERELPDDATLDDVTAILAGTPADVATAAAALPQHRRDELWARLAADRDRAHGRTPA
jgi:hypothetical protein